MQKGLALFDEATPPSTRRRRLVVMAVLLVASAALIWPIHDVFGGIYPLVLGLPLSMAWVVLWLLVVFGAILWVYLKEER